MEDEWYQIKRQVINRKVQISRTIGQHGKRWLRIFAHLVSNGEISISN